MHRSWLGGSKLWPVCSLVLALTVCPPGLQGQVDGRAAEVRAREIAFAKTMEDRDLDAFLTFVSPEAIFFNGNEPIRGRDEIVQAWAPFFEGPAAPF